MTETDDRAVPFLIKGPSFSSGVPSATEVESFRQELFGADALSLFGYWISKCSADDIPRKDQIDPVDLPKLLSRIYIEEWDQEQRQSRLRLAGEFHREIYGGNVRGLAVDDHAIGVTKEIWKQCDQHNFFELRPTFCGYTLDRAAKAFLRVADLTLPVRDKGEAVLTIGIISPF